MISIHFTPEIAAKVLLLRDDSNCAEEVRRTAGHVMDLTALLEIWLVPGSLKLDDELQREVSRLCRLSGGKLCGTNHCVAHDGAGSHRICQLNWITK